MATIADDDGGADLLAMIELLPVVNLPLAALAGGFALRLAGDDSEHVRMLAESASAALFPPILVQRSSSRVIDGEHRVAAARLRRDAGIAARMVDCTDTQALVLAMRSNSAHGLPLSRADRIAGARNILAVRPDWSDRAVAEAAGMSAKAVASLRGGAGTPGPAGDRRLGRDGKWRPVHASEGRTRVAECLTAHPEASLRAVARAAGVSLGTAHDVKEQLRREAEPGPAAAGQPESGPGTGTTSPARSQSSNPLQSSQPSRPPSAKSRVRRPPLATVMANLAGDPSLRYTDGGRAFLRWMSRHAMPSGEWREFTEVIPEYWLADVSEVAAAMSEEWRQLALSLGSRQREAS
jgi:hypothetical protein